MDELLATQKEEIDLLRERIRQLEEALMPSEIEVPVEWQLPRCEKRLFVLLTQRPIVTKELAHMALYSDRHDSHEYPVEIVESHMSKLRKKLRRYGIEITAKRFIGYSLIGRERFAKRATA